MERITKDGHIVIRWGKGMEDGFYTSLFTYIVLSKNGRREVTDIKRVRKYVKEVFPEDILGTMEIISRNEDFCEKIILVGKSA